jgi:ubiquinone/menaquinone biosynthesis C-methylase UbiE
MVTPFVIAPVTVLSEVRRTLAPGGRLLILDLTAHEREEYSLQMGHIWQGFAEPQLRAWVEEAGLSVVRYRELPADPKAKGPALFSLLVQKGKR